MDIGKHRRDENFSFIISSETDARKKPVSFSISKKALVIILAAASLFVLAIAGMAVFLLIQNSGSTAEIKTLQEQLESQNKLIETYSNELQSLQLTMQKNASQTAAVQKSTAGGNEPAPQASETHDAYAVQETQAANASETQAASTETLSKAVLAASASLEDDEAELEGDASIDPLYDPSLEFEIEGPQPKNGDINGKVELIDWFHGGSKVFARNTKAVVIDVLTGKQFNVIRLGGKYHADSEPLTKDDTAVYKEIYGGKWSWDRRAILVKIGERYIAASMHGMPHMVDRVNNGFPGHFCIHFLNSKVHETGKPCARHQRCVQYAFKYGNSVIE